MATVVVAHEVAEESGINKPKKFIQEIAKDLSKQDLPVVWQRLADIQAQNTTEADPFALVKRIVDEAYAIHTEQKVSPLRIATQGLGKKLRKHIGSQAERPEPEVENTPPELNLPEMLQPLDDNPAVAEKLQAVVAAEQKYHKEHEQLEGTVQHHFENRKDLYAHASQAFQENVDSTNTTILRSMTTKSVNTLETEETEKITIAIDENNAFFDNKDHIDSKQGMDKVISIIREKFRQESLKNIKPLQLEAFDTIIDQLDPEYNKNDESNIALTKDNLAFVAAAVALIHIQGFEEPARAEEGGVMAWITEYSSHLQYLVQDNPGFLAQYGDDGLVQIVDGSQVMRVKRSGESHEERQLYLDANHTVLPHKQVTVRKGRALLEFTGKPKERVENQLGSRGFVKPAREFSQYAYSQTIYRHSNPTEFYRQLSSAFADSWNDMPLLDEERREIFRNNYVEKRIDPLLSGIDQYCWQMRYSVDLLGKAAGIGTPSALVNNPETLDKIEELDAQLCKMADPLTARAELHIMGIDALELTQLLHDKLYEQVGPDCHRSLITERFLRRYSGILSNFVNGIFGTEDNPQPIKPEDIVSHAEIDEWSMASKATEAWIRGMQQAPRRPGW